MTTNAHGVGETDEIERFGYTWVLDSQYVLTNLADARRIQVREPEHLAPRDVVAKYKVFMKAGSKFPPIVVTKDGWLVSGNTRIAAATELGYEDFPAVILDVTWKTATDKQKNRLHLLAGTLNSMHGTSLTPKESRVVVARAIQEGWTAEKIGRVTGVKPQVVTTVKQELAAEEKLRRVGIPLDSLHGVSLRALGGPAAQSLTDMPFRALTELANDAGLSAQEINALAKDVRALGSEAEQITALVKHRDEMGLRVSERKLTGVGKPPLARQLRQHLGFVTKFAGREAELVELSQASKTAHLETLRKALDVLTVVSELMMEAKPE